MGSFLPIEWWRKRIDSLIESLASNTQMKKEYNDADKLVDAVLDARVPQELQKDKIVHTESASESSSHSDLDCGDAFITRDLCKWNGGVLVATRWPAPSGSRTLFVVVWVKDGKVYRINYHADRLASDLPAAPSFIRDSRSLSQYFACMRRKGLNV